MKKIIASLLMTGLFGIGIANAQGIEAGSWGGKVRGGPGTQFRQIGSLQNGDPVQLLEDTRVMMNGYPWYRISFKNGKVGYQWGGILCSFGNPIGGVYEVCERDNRRSTSNQNTGVQQFACSAEGRMKSRSGDTSTEISFSAIGENDETQFRIYWLDYNGRRQFYKHIFAGDVYRQSTFLTHPWVITAPIPGGGEDCIAVYLPGSTPQNVVLR